MRRRAFLELEVRMGWMESANKKGVCMVDLKLRDLGTTDDGWPTVVQRVWDNGAFLVIIDYVCVLSNQERGVALFMCIAGGLVVWRWVWKDDQRVGVSVIGMTLLLGG